MKTGLYLVWLSILLVGVLSQSPVVTTSTSSEVTSETSFSSDDVSIVTTADDDESDAVGVDTPAPLSSGAPPTMQPVSSTNSPASPETQTEMPVEGENTMEPSVSPPQPEATDSPEALETLSPDQETGAPAADLTPTPVVSPAPSSESDVTPSPDQTTSAPDETMTPGPSSSSSVGMTPNPSVSGETPSPEEESPAPVDGVAFTEAPMDDDGSNGASTSTGGLWGAAVVGAAGFFLVAFGMAP